MSKQQTANVRATIVVLGIDDIGFNIVGKIKNSDMSDVKYMTASTNENSLSKKNRFKINRLIENDMVIGDAPEYRMDHEKNIVSEIRSSLINCDILFIITDFGERPVSGVTLAITEVAKEMGILTIGIFTYFFGFDCKRCKYLERQDIKELTNKIDSIISFQVEKITFDASSENTILDFCNKSIYAISDMINGISKLSYGSSCLMNLDFADLKSVMNEAGLAMIGTGIGVGVNRAQVAIKSAISSPSLIGLNIASAQRCLIHIMVDSDSSPDEFDLVDKTITEIISGSSG